MTDETRSTNRGITVPLKREAASELRRLGLRPTRQRVYLRALLIGAGSVHLSPREVFERMNQIGARVSLATIYNNLKQFAETGLIRQITGHHGETIFDTNARPHHHILNEDTGTICDTDQIDYVLGDHFPISSNQEVSSIEITVKLRWKCRNETAVAENIPYRPVRALSEATETTEEGKELTAQRVRPATKLA
jgi:Fur family iron response transcriptional regulator